MSRDNISVTAIFGGLCIAGVIGVAFEFRHDFPTLVLPVSHPEFPSKSLELAVPPEAVVASKTVGVPLPSPPPPVPSVASPAVAPEAAREAMEKWWTIHQMETIESWWKYHQIATWWNATHMPKGRTRVASPSRSLHHQPAQDTRFAEQTWGSADIVPYDPPRYLTDTSRWPLHGPEVK